MKKILFISHEASRTGAPMVLLYFLKWLQHNQKEIMADVLVLNGGALNNEFKSLSINFYDYPKIIKQVPLKFWQRVLLKLKLYKKADSRAKLLLELGNNNYDLIYANTIVSIPLAADIKKQNTTSKLLVHVHEMKSVLELYRNAVLPFITDINQIITVSEEATKHFVNFTKVDRNKVKMIYEFSDKFFQKAENNKTHFIIGGSGTTNFRKGTDLFIQLANLQKKNYQNLAVKFVWVGAVTDEFKVFIENEIEKLDIADVIEFIGELENPEEVYKTFDLFVLSSREDPFPLVCIEMGRAGIPVICFDKGNGIMEIVASGGGKVVPYLDLYYLLENIAYYCNDYESYKKDCLLIQKQFSIFSSDIQSPTIFTILQSLSS